MSVDRLAVVDARPAELLEPVLLQLGVDAVLAAAPVHDREIRLASDEAPMRLDIAHHAREAVVRHLSGVEPVPVLVRVDGEPAAVERPLHRRVDDLDHRPAPATHVDVRNDVRLLEHVGELEVRDAGEDPELARGALGRRDEGQEGQDAVVRQDADAGVALRAVRVDVDRRELRHRPVER